MAKGWSFDPRKFSGMVAEDVSKLQRSIAIQLLSNIVMRSPVGNPELWAINHVAAAYNNAVIEHNDNLRNDPSNLTKNGRLKKGLKLHDGMDIKAPAGYIGGRFRASHVVSIDAKDMTVTTGVDKSGMQTIANGTAVIEQSPAYCAIYIQTNLPYAEALENGHSTQAPAGVYSVSFHGIAQAFK